VCILYQRYLVLHEGWLSPTEHASVSAHFGLPWVRSCDNRGKFYTDEKAFNAGQTHRSIYSSIFNRLRAIAWYWSEITIFPNPLHLTPPLVVFPLEFRGKVWSSKTRIMGLPSSEDSLTIGWAISTQYTSSGTVSYSPSIVTMAVSAATLEIFSVKEWSDLEIWVWGPWRSLKMALFDKPCMTFY